jgi:hypothetical protein
VKPAAEVLGVLPARRSGCPVSQFPNLGDDSWVKKQLEIMGGLITIKVRLAGGHPFIEDGTLRISHHCTSLHWHASGHRQEPITGTAVAGLPPGQPGRTNLVRANAQRLVAGLFSRILDYLVPAKRSADIEENRKFIAGILDDILPAYKLSYVRYYVTLPSDQVTDCAAGNGSPLYLAYRERVELKLIALYKLRFIVREDETIFQRELDALVASKHSLHVLLTAVDDQFHGLVLS